MLKYFLKTILIISFIIIALPASASLIDDMKDIIDTSQIDLAAGDSENPELVIAAMFQYVLGFLGVVFFILIVYGGIIWMTAQGNEQKISKAKSILISASVGIGIVLFAYAISYLVIWILQNTGLGG